MAQKGHTKMWQNLGQIFKSGTQFLLILYVSGVCVLPVIPSAVSLLPQTPDAVPSLFFYSGG